MAPTNTMTLKLLFDSKSNKVLFAEASKDFVDFLFLLLSLPIATVINLLGAKSMVGSIGNLHKSFSDLHETFLEPNLQKKTLLNPMPSTSVSNDPLLLGCSQAAPPKKFYTCRNNCSRAMTDTSDSIACPDCSSSSRMSMEIQYIPSSNVTEFKGKGYVKEVVSYMISDDLSVTPMSMISSISMMNKFQISQLNVLKEREVNVGTEDALELLKVSFQSTTVLTDVFLAENKRMPTTP